MHLKIEKNRVLVVSKKYDTNAHVT